MITRPQTGHNFPKGVKKKGEKSHLPSSSKRLTIKSFFGDNIKGQLKKNVFDLGHIEKCGFLHGVQYVPNIIFAK